MSWNTLEPQLFNLINDNKTALGIQDVKSFPTLSFRGYPAVSIYPSDNTNVYETTTENERIYVWKLRIFYDTKSTGLENALSALREVTDDVMDKIDQENELNTGQTIGVSMPTNYTFINIFATPAAWGQTGDENLTFSELNVSMRVSFDAT